ncbi:PKS-NRPS hybrid synthetase cheA-like [Solanum lycopersicum]|uniref:PKS-NRPS hybrid synthetase cheA-like n=1 Tax=Solanum lycopersicum TaxID=4081 RepID=UPI003749304A
MFKIREFESEHTCLLLHNSLLERLATKSVVGSIIVGKHAEPDANYTPKDIQRDMLAEYGVRLTYMQAWRAKEAALELIRGDPIRSYAKLPSYFHILEATYPGSHIRFHKSEDDRFLYAFVALFTSIKGWEYCRPIVVVDGTFLKGAYKGTLLTANTLDAAGSILPLAYAIVDSENDSSWRWFFEQFRDAFGQRPEMCILSDRHASIIKAVSTVYDEVPHFACMWHLLQNIMKNFRRSQQRVTELFYSGKNIHHDRI